MPGNGCPSSLESLRDANFYGGGEAAFAAAGFPVRLSPMPDPLYARESVWIPFITDSLCGGAAGAAESVVIGHSSGAAAALRLAEATRLRGLVLVAAYDSDLGDETERLSGYFTRPFDWARIVENCGFILQWAAVKDSLLPIAYQRKVARHLAEAAAAAGRSDAVKLIEHPLGDHFFDEPMFPGELLAGVQDALLSSRAARTA